MRIYLISVPHEDAPKRFAATLGEAHEVAKFYAVREDVRISLQALGVDRESIVSLLNGTHQPKTLREWKLSKRGGLVEVALGTDRPLKGAL